MDNKIFGHGIHTWSMGSVSIFMSCCAKHFHYLCELHSLIKKSFKISVSKLLYWQISKSKTQGATSHPREVLLPSKRSWGK